MTVRSEADTDDIADELGGTNVRAVVLAIVPVIALTVGIPFANRVDPRIFGLPFLPAYIALWILLTPLFMIGVYRSEHRA